jgi:hypothetical protein
MTNKGKLTIQNIFAGISCKLIMNDSLEHPVSTYVETNTKGTIHNSKLANTKITIINEIILFMIINLNCYCYISAPKNLNHCTFILSRLLL